MGKKKAQNILLCQLISLSINLGKSQGMFVLFCFTFPQVACSRQRGKNVEAIFAKVQKQVGTALRKLELMANLRQF